MELSGDAQRLAESLERLDKSLGKLESRGWGGSSNVTINAGGVGVAVSLMCVVILVVISIFQNIESAQMSRKYDRMQDHLSAIYMMAPQLRPKDVNDHSDNSTSDKDSGGKGSSSASP